jgi:UDP-N-acetylmuramate dehydrogenase
MTSSLVTETLIIEDNVSLQSYNTLAVPAMTRWFAIVNTIAELQQALHFITVQKCPLLVLGEGSNIVLADDFNGLSLLMNIRGHTIETETDSDIFLSVAAGEKWHDTVMFCVNQGWYGIENLALIPGSVGAAPIQNIGAYGVELTDCLSYVEGIDIVSGEIVTLTNAACEFAYRESIFKHQLKDRVIITRVVLHLSKQKFYRLDYPALQAALASYDIAQLDSLAIANAVSEIRRSKLPDPAIIPNAGSFFKNPIVPAAVYEQIQENYPEVVGFPLPETDNLSLPYHPKYKLAAGWLLEHAGWKGKDQDGIMMHRHQALVLTNPHRLSGRALLAFVGCVQADIQQKYGLCLEIEPRVYGK